MRRKRWLLYIIWICLVCAGCDVQAKDEAAAEAQETEQAYQEFLNGDRKVHIEEEAREFFGEEFSGTEKDGVFLQDIMQYVCDYIDEVFLKKMETVQYAYLDCGNDGKQELAVTFCGTVPVDGASCTMVIVCEKGELYLRHVSESRARSQEDLYYYGYIEKNGSGSAYTNYPGETVLDSTGKACVIYEETQDYGSERTVAEEVFGKEEIYICRETYTIGKKTYDCILPADEEIDLSKWEDYCRLYEKEYGKLYTQEAIEGIIQKRREAFKIEAQQLEKKEPEWHLLENPIYRDYVKQIALLESRREQQRESTSVLKDRWVSCDLSRSSDKNDYERTGSFVLDWDWMQAIGYIVADYGSKAHIPRGRWAVTDLVSYNGDGDGIYAVTVRFADPEREICLLVSSDAVDMQMEEYAAYIVAVDFQYDDKGKYEWGEVSYDSMMIWESYARQAKMDAVQLYTVNGSASRIYGFEWKCVDAMNQYLINKGADPSISWELDVNAVCTVGDGRMEIVRYFSKEEEIVMVLDEQNKKFAIVKGLDGD